MLAVLADGVGSPVDQGVSTFLFIGAVLFGIVAVARLRGRAFTGLSTAVGWGAGASDRRPGIREPRQAGRCVRDEGPEQPATAAPRPAQLVSSIV